MQFSNDKPIYIQIGDYVMEKILLDEWKQNEKILSVRDLGSELEVNPNTVMRAYEILQQQGIIFNKRGLGFFVDPGAKNIIAGLRKKIFIDTELPALFRNMELLDISIDEIVRYYKKNR